MIKRIVQQSFIIVLIMVFCTIPATAEVPYEAYNYDYWEDVVPSPAAYVPADSLSGDELGVGKFLQPTDMCVGADGNVYILDSGNNRIVIFDQQWNVVEIIDTFSNAGVEDTFNTPGGIYVQENGDIYIADSSNNRVVGINAQREVISIIDNPKSETLSSDFVFVPLRVGVDYANRVYVIAKNMFQGIMGFNENGDFYGYVGTNKVSVSPADILWRKLSTKAQRKKQVLFIPTEFTALDLDSEGFLFTTNVDLASDETIKRLNPAGKDVLKRQGNNVAIKGDLVFRTGVGGRYSGPSKFIDIVVRESGIYSALDSQRGRIFTYDSEGNLLYVFGTVGTQLGTFRSPVAIEVVGNQMVVLDRERAEIITFDATQYGSLINTAVELRFDGNEEQAVDYWNKVLKLNSNFELAYNGIGKSLLSSNHNKEAMQYFELGMNQQYYSIAYKRYRNEFLKENLPIAMTVIFGIIILGVFYKQYKKLSVRRKMNNA